MYKNSTTSNISDISRDRQIIAAAGETREKEFWVKKLSGGPLITGVPGDETNAAARESRTETVTFKIENPLYTGLVNAGGETDYKMHVLLTAGVVVLLGKYYGAEEENRDVLVAAPIYNPGQEGEFINTILPLRISQGPGKTYKDILKEVSRAIMEAAEHQNYPVRLLYGDGAKEVAQPRIAILLENIHDRRHIEPMKPAVLYSFHHEPGGIAGRLEYQTALYEEWYPTLMVKHFQQILEELTTHREEPLNRIEIITPGEKRRISSASPEPARTGETIVYMAPRNKIEAQLEIIWADVLEQEKTAIGIDANFFQLNGNSLRTIMLISRIFKEFNLRVPLAEVFKHPTIRQLAGYLQGAVGNRYEAIEPVEKKEYYVLSSAQKRLYFIQQLDLDSDIYNVPDVVPAASPMEIVGIKETVSKMVQRHDSFRTSFDMIDGQPGQRIHPANEIEIDIETYETGEDQIQEIIKNFVRPFDLRQPPLLRLGVINVKNSPQTYLVFDMHHIITDAFSKNIFIREFQTLSRGQELPLLKLQYKDYAAWQNSGAQQEAAARREQYWLGLLKGEIPQLCLPTDNQRPAKPRYKGRTLGFKMEPDQLQELYQHARDEGVTIFMLLLGIYLVMLARLSGREDIIVGTVNAGRSHVDMESIVGMFVNTLVLRNRVDPAKTFADFLQDVKTNTLEAFENQDYQYEDLVEKIAANKKLKRRVIFDVLLVVGNIDLRARENKQQEIIPDIQQKTIGYQNRTSKFDMTLFYHEDARVFEWEYSSELYKEETIKEFIGYIKEIAAMVVRHPQIKIRDIKISHDLLASKNIEPVMEFEF